MTDAAWGSWDDHGRPPKYGRPPQHPGYSQSAVPSWEKRFCTSVCLIPWGRICAAKVSLSVYKNIAEWDDAASFEAFQNAKARYWAYINNLPCDIPLPDPDMYIGRVNHKVVIDPKLIEDLEKQQPHSLPDCKKDGSSGWDSIIFENKQTPATGCGNGWDGSTADHHSVNWDKFVDQQRLSTVWGDSNLPRNGDSSKAGNFCGGWGDVTTHDCSRGGEQKNNSWNSGKDPSWGQHSNKWNNEQGNINNRKRNRGHYDSRFSKSSQMNNCQVNRSNCTEMRMQNYPCEKTMHVWQPMFMQQSKSRKSCGPVNHQRSSESGGSWYQYVDHAELRDAEAY